MSPVFINYDLHSDGRYLANFPKREYLLEIRQRLINEVDPYIKICESKKWSMGYWGMVRLLMPVIESVGYVKYRELGAKYKYAGKVLEDLNVPYPRLTWKIFRNSLLHSDEITPLVNHGSEETFWAGWQLNFDQGHNDDPQLLKIDLKKLYWDLRSYIDNLVNILAQPVEPLEPVPIKAMHISQKELDSDPKLKAEYDKLFQHVKQNPPKKGQTVEEIITRLTSQKTA